MMNKIKVKREYDKMSLIIIKLLEKHSTKKVFYFINKYNPAASAAPIIGPTIGTHA